MSKLVSSYVEMQQKGRPKRFGRLFFVCLVLLGLFFFLGRGDGVNKNQPHIATLRIEGMIMQDLALEETLKQLEVNPHVKGVVVYVNSGGGTMTGGLSIYEGLKNIRTQKPVVVLMGDVAASAGYMAALGGEYIVASPATLTGSVGVFMPLVDATGLLGKVGIKPAPVVSGDLKIATLPVISRTKKQDDYLQSMVMDLQELFLQVVLENRQLTETQVKIISDGRALTGRQAKSLGLIDALGTQFDAKAYLFTVKNVDKALPFVEYKWAEKQSLLREILVGDLNNPRLSKVFLTHIGTILSVLHLPQ